MGEVFHTPVMASEVLHFLDHLVEDVVLDATVGGGGHAREILVKFPGVRIVGIDRDPEALEESAKSLAPFAQRVTLLQSPFSRMEDVIEDLGLEGVGAVLMDLGVSSHQLGVPERGFTYWGEALDMRMNPEDPLDARQIVNTWDEGEITAILRRYGQERWASRIARFIVERRPIESAGKLVEVIKDAIPARYRRTGPHPARRTFQALRMAVNREMDELEQGLQGAIKVCRPGGRLLVIAYHSLEDRLVKMTFREEHERGSLQILTKKANKPTPEEIQENPRSRSALLRVAEKTLGIGTPGRE